MNAKPVKYFMYIKDIVQASRVWLVLFLSFCLLGMTGCSLFSSKRGGYYQNDGPGDPSQMSDDNFKDAIPRVEPLMSGPNKPYTVNGVRYVPDTREIPYRARGMASWYGKQFHGRKTSSGEVFDMYAMTAAHATLPIPSYVHVTNVSNGRSVIVRINDRGPFSDKRLIDLSYGAAYRLGFVNAGVTEVIVERIMPADIAAGRIPPATVSSSTSTGTSSTPSGPVNSISGGYFVQIGAYSTMVNAQKTIDSLVAYDGSLRANLVAVQDGRYFKVYAGPYSSDAQAQRVGTDVERYLGNQVLILDRRY